MTVIVDASVAFKWFVREELHAEALALLDHPRQLHAPDLIVAEVANVAWKACRRGDIVRAQAEAIAAAISHYIPTLHLSATLAPAALEFALALDHPVYDCLYLACARTVDGILITADRRFHDAVRGGDDGERIRHLETASA